MGRFRITFCAFCALFFAISAAHRAGAAIIRVTTDVEGNLTQIEQNQTVTINVRALVEGPASANDGIFTFDNDLIIANIINGDPSVLAVQSITRPNVSDNLFGGSDGTSGPNGLQAIHGGYLDETAGIGTPALLFSVVLKGVGVGTDSIISGPSTDPFGFDFVLYQSSLTNTSVTYDGGALVTVIAGNGGGGTGGGGNNVPLPAGMALGAMGAALVPALRRRLR